MTTATATLTAREVLDQLLSIPFAAREHTCKWACAHLQWAHGHSTVRT